MSSGETLLVTPGATAADQALANAALASEQADDDDGEEQAVPAPPLVATARVAGQLGDSCRRS